jgi:hypothetical protein
MGKLTTKKDIERINNGCESAGCDPITKSEADRIYNAAKQTAHEIQLALNKFQKEAGTYNYDPFDDSPLSEISTGEFTASIKCGKNKKTRY